MFRYLFVLLTITSFLSADLEEKLERLLHFPEAQLDLQEEWIDYLSQHACDESTAAYEAYLDGRYETSLELIEKGEYDLSALSKTQRKQIKPYLISQSHPLYNSLHTIFSNSRASYSSSALNAAGFHILYSKPRSFIQVVSHPLLPGHLVKLITDKELRDKHGKDECYWFAKRCEGARKIAKVIKKGGIRHFVVAEKFIYPLPANPAPPSTENIHRKKVVLLVTDMQLVPKQQNLEFWKTKITVQHLRELYTIITLSGGSSYRPDNVWFTKSGKIAFIDTEYPNQAPSYRGVEEYLSPEMRKYWEMLTK